MAFAAENIRVLEERTTNSLTGFFVSKREGKTLTESPEWGIGGKVVEEEEEGDAFFFYEK